MSQSSSPRSPEPPRGWHPWLFMLAFGTGVAALVQGDGAVAFVCGLVMFWTLGVL